MSRETIRDGDGQVLAETCVDRPLTPEARTALAALTEAARRWMEADGDTDLDRDPEALAWARAKVQHHIDRARAHHTSATAAGKTEQAETWRRLANHMQRTLIGGTGCVIAAFDERLPLLPAATKRTET